MTGGPRPESPQPAGRALEWVSLAGAVLRRPGLWPVALKLVPPRWWRRWPPLPVPPADYARFRMQTMYGSNGHLDAAELVRYLDWCRRMDRPAR